MGAAISALPYSDKIYHLLCTFHLFDLNVKKKVQPALQSKNGVDSWPKFRSALEVYREAGCETEIERLWDDLLQEWFEDDEISRKSVEYLEKYVWSRRQNWATCYFRSEFTMGHSTTQRAES